MNESQFIPAFPTHQSWQKDGPTLSFSEISTWLQCPYRHMLAYVKRINTFEENVNTSFGDIGHSFAESFLMTRHVDPTQRAESPITIQVLEEKLRAVWEKFNFGDPTASPAEEPVNWVSIIGRVVDDIGPFMDSTFTDWKCIDAEHRLFEKIDDFPPTFKGYIDGVISCKDSRGKDVYWLIDWKFTNFWSAEKKSDMNVLLQLILYKHFWAQKNGIPLSSVRCGFILAKKSAKPGKTFELVPVSVGPVTIAKGIKIIRNMLSSVTRGIYLKKRMNCKYCPYAGTEHCP